MTHITHNSRMNHEANPGNRRGITPARMVGFFLRSENKSFFSKDAGRVHMIIGRIIDLVLPFIFSTTCFATVLVPSKTPQINRKNIPTMNRVLGNQIIVPHKADASPEEWAAAVGIEALMVDQLLSEMRKTIHESELIPVSHAEKVYRQMLDSEYSRQLSNSGSLGIADLVVAEMRRAK